jgi:acyl-CoA thioesterase FadM
MLSLHRPASVPHLEGIDLRVLPSAESHRTFRWGFDIYLKDSNAYTNTYFSRYFEWQGVCRERWFHQCISQDMLQTQGVFITKRAHTEYLHETYPFQGVECELNSWDVRQCSFYLLFRFSVAQTLVATGFQQIVFARQDKRIQRLPADVLDRIREFELVSGDVSEARRPLARAGSPV